MENFIFCALEDELGKSLRVGCFNVLTCQHFKTNTEEAIKNFLPLILAYERITKCVLKALRPSFPILPVSQHFDIQNTLVCSV